MAAHVFEGAGSAFAGDERQAISIKTAQAHASVTTGAMCLRRFIVHATLTTTIMTPQPSLLPGHRLIPDLNLAHQVLATVLILNLNITSVPFGSRPSLNAVFAILLPYPSSLRAIVAKSIRGGQPK